MYYKGALSGVNLYPDLQGEKWTAMNYMDQMDQMDQLDQAKAINHEHIAGNLIMALIVVFVPVLGHIILTAIILRDDLKFWEKVAWIVVIWVVWWVGPFLYLLLGQRRNRLLNFL
jgi:hypothetical protein